MSGSFVCVHPAFVESNIVHSNGNLSKLKYCSCLTCGTEYIKNLEQLVPIDSHFVAQWLTEEIMESRR